MRKAASILALALVSLGMFSCESENTVDETQALYHQDTKATDNADVKEDPRE